jgi:hypothetical protein
LAVKRYGRSKIDPINLFTYTKQKVLTGTIKVKRAQEIFDDVSQNVSRDITNQLSRWLYWRAKGYAVWKGSLRNSMMLSSTTTAAGEIVVTFNAHPYIQKLEEGLPVGYIKPSREIPNFEKWVYDKRVATGAASSVKEESQRIRDKWRKEGRKGENRLKLDKFFLV